MSLRDNRPIRHAERSEASPVGLDCAGRHAEPREQRGKLREASPVRLNDAAEILRRAQNDRIEPTCDPEKLRGFATESARRPVCFVHPLALCESSQVGEGTRVWAFAQIMEGATLGRDCNVGGHAFIESGAKIGDRVTIKNGAMIWRGVTIEDDCFIGPGVIFTNDRHPRSPRSPEAAERYAQQSRWLSETRVRRGASLGAGAVILPGITIGEFATTGAAAVVTTDLAAYRIAIGQPARAVGWACMCGIPLAADLICGQCGRRYELHGHQMRPKVSH